MGIGRREALMGAALGGLATAVSGAIQTQARGIGRGGTEARPNADFGFLYWAHGFRRRSPDGKRLLCVRTSRYGIALDIETLSVLHMGPLTSKMSYERAVSEPNDAVFGLRAADLTLTVESSGARYRCVGAARDTRDELSYPVRIIEMGRHCQRFDVLQLEFADDRGTRLQADARLEVVAWPDRIAFLLEVVPARDLPDGSVRASFAGAASAASEHGPWKAGQLRTAWASRSFGPGAASADGVVISARGLTAGVGELPITNDAARGWTRVVIPSGNWQPDRDFDHLDRYELNLSNQSATERTVRLQFARDQPFPGITGMVAVLRDAAGRPLGIPVQISKNWHRQPDRRLLYEGPWFHGFAMLRLPARSEHRLELTIANCRWGGVPSASHAQLCLIGWGVNQQWDQAAIGSWGESICYDPDVNLNRSMVDDIRPLMVRAMGTKDGRWSWTNNVGGGDFLVLVDRDGKRQPLVRMRTAFLSHGPNLTRVVYAGCTPGGEIEARIEVSTPRTDDINRAYHRILYNVRKPVDFSRLAFYQIGADNYNDHRFAKLAFGNRDGLVEEWDVQAGGRRYHRSAVPLTGRAPWVSLHAVVNGDPKGGAWAARGLLVRHWQARLGGRVVPVPLLSSYGTENGPPSANAELAPPRGLTRLAPGDFVEADLELVILPVAASDYYGPDEELRAALSGGADTWRMVHREARGNDLAVVARDGVLERRTPVVVRSRNGSTAAVQVQGGLGYVPVTFSGLKSPTGYELRLVAAGGEEIVDQSVHGEDWYQCTYDDDTTSYALTYTLPLGRWGNEPVVLKLTPPRAVKVVTEERR